MNKERRKRIKDANKRLDEIIVLLNNYRDIIDDVKIEEEIAFDNLPEGFQEGLRGMEMQEAIDTLDEALDNIDNMIEELGGFETDLINI